MIHTLFSLETDSIRRFRVLVAIICLAHLSLRLPDVALFFSDNGFLPASALTGHSRFTLHLLSHSVIYQYALIIVSIGFCITLALGIHPRLSVFCLWALTLSTQNRNPLITEGYDLYVRSMLLLTVFLPLSTIEQKQNRRVFCVGTAAVIVQVFLVYFLNARHKWHTTWLDGSALQLVFQYGYYPTRIGKTLLAWPGLLRVLTYGTLIFEALFPFLLFCPYHPRACRKIFSAALFTFHLGILLTINVTFFSLLGMAVAVLLWPSGKEPKQTEIIPFPLATATACGLVIGFFLWEGIENGADRALKKLPPSVELAVRAFGLNQSWKMFSAPSPDYPHLFVVGIKANGDPLSLPARKPFHGFDSELTPWSVRDTGLSKSVAMQGTSAYLSNLIPYFCRTQGDLKEVRLIHTFRQKDPEVLIAKECKS